MRDVITALINGQIYNVVPVQEMQNPVVYNNPQNAALFTDPVTGQQYILPVRKANDSEVGLYKSGPVNFVNLPQPGQDEYMYGNPHMVNFGDTNSVHTLLQKTEALKQIECEILTNSQNIFSPQIKDTDTPIMKALKTAIQQKNFDFDKYAYRFGPNYANDKRKFNDPDITLERLIRIANNTDMRVTVTISDNDPDVPNPMGTPVTVTVTGVINKEE